MATKKEAFLYAKSIEIAALFHGDTLDKGGEPYINHPMRVASRCADIKAKCVGWLHDVLEDTKCTFKCLMESGIDDAAILDGLDGVTKRHGETYTEFIIRSSQNPISAEVKMADLRDNLKAYRLPMPPKKKDFDRSYKYAVSLAFLEGKITLDEFKQYEID